MDPLINCQLLIYCEKTSTANCPRKIYWINLTYFNNPLAPVYGGMRENFKGPKKNYDLKQLLNSIQIFKQSNGRLSILKKEAGYGKGESVYLLMMYFAYEGTDMTHD